MNEYDDILNRAYDVAISMNAKNEDSLEIPNETKKEINIIVERAESNKGIIAVLTTLLTYKVKHPEQDIRYHQAQQKNGFSGRTIDTDYITPWIRRHDFPAMAESGWLTRSLEQPVPYNLEYPGKITPAKVKKAFLDIIDSVQTKNRSAEQTLEYFLYALVEIRDRSHIDLAKPHSKSIADTVELLKGHFTYQYSSSGAARLPVLAIYAAYQCMMGELARYRDMRLLPIEAHNSADVQSGRIGDIDIWYIGDETAFEGVEIKHEIIITPELVRYAYEKFKIHKTDRYYLLTTSDMGRADWDAINKEIRRISSIHGCQVIVNGVYDTLKYYLRLLRDTSDFIECYVELLKSDKTIKFEHKKAWNDLISNGG